MAEMASLVYLQRAQIMMSVVQDCQVSLDDINTAIDLDPGSIRARMGKGYLYEWLGYRMDAYYIRGLCCVETDDTEQAIEDMERALEMTSSATRRSTASELWISFAGKQRRKIFPSQANRRADSKG